MGKLVVANWKMNKTNDEAEQFIQNLCPLVKKNDQFWICPPATVLSLVFKNLNGIGQVGAQNIYFETKVRQW